MTQFGRYEILDELGRGGFGTVYKAKDKVLGRLVALKILHAALVVEPDFIARFRQEARTAALFDHPNLVPVYDFSETEGRYYIAMGYMPGGSLKDLLKREGKLEPERACEVLAQLGEGLKYAHARGIIHRDLKPGNILFDESGRARVADMGFAKVMSEGASRSMSASGGLVGTPAYMAPETWRNKPATPQTDIYSLGCILYEMLTGRVLFEGESPADIMTMHVMDGPQYAEDLPQELRPVLDKALQRDPTQRFVDTQALLAGFRSVLEPEEEPVIGPIVVKPEPPIIPKINESSETRTDNKGSEVEKPGKSNLAVGMIGVSVVLFLIFIFIWVSGPRGGTDLPDNTVTTQASITDTKAPLVQQSATAAKPTQPTAITVSTQKSMTGASVITLANAGQFAQLCTLEGHTSGVYSVAWSPDGKTLASGSGDGTIILWKADSGEKLRTLEGHTRGVRSVAWSPDGKTLASGSYDNTIILWAADSGAQLRTLEGHTDWVRSLAWSPDGTTLASGSYRTIILWDADSGAKLRTLEGHTEGVRSVAWSPDGTALASGSDDGTIILWKADSGEWQRRLEAHLYGVWSVAWSPDGTTLATGSEFGKIILWNADSGAILRTLKGHTNVVSSVAWSPDGTGLASGSDDGTIILWNADSGVILRTVKGHTDWVNSVAWSPDGTTLASASRDGTIRLWGIP